MSTALQNISPFDETLADHGLHLTRQKSRVLQLNIGKLCNLTGVHCLSQPGPQIALHLG
jgi:hypothetical protein